MFKIDGLLTQLEKDRLLFVSEAYHFRHLFIDKNDIIDNMTIFDLMEQRNSTRAIK